MNDNSGRVALNIVSRVGMLSREAREAVFGTVLYLTPLQVWKSIRRVRSRLCPVNICGQWGLNSIWSFVCWSGFIFNPDLILLDSNKLGPSYSGFQSPGISGMGHHPWLISWLIKNNQPWFLLDKVFLGLQGWPQTLDNPALACKWWGLLVYSTISGFNIIFMSQNNTLKLK